jgi:hypothetical protein
MGPCPVESIREPGIVGCLPSPLRFFHPPAGVYPAQKKARNVMEVHELRTLVNQLGDVTALLRVE